MLPLVAQPACGAFEMTQKHATMERISLDSARVSRVGDCVLAIANFSQTLRSPSQIGPRDKVRFGAAPKPTREMRVLP
jgi:hypothetical protein